MIKGKTTIESICENMGLTQIAGDWEQTLANNLGITQSVNGSWLQAMYPTVDSLRSQLVNQTYSGISIYGADLYELYINGDEPIGYMGYAYNENNIYVPQGLYIYNGIQWIWQPTNFITWLTDDIYEIFKINNTDSIQSTNIAGVTASIMTINSTIAGITASIANPTYDNSPSRPVNSTSFQISTTKKTRVTYTISVTTALSLLNLNSAGNIYLEISSNNSTWVIINSAGVSKTLGVGLSINETTQFNIQGEVPTGYYCRLRSVTSGGASTAFVSGQEVQY